MKATHQQFDSVDPAVRVCLAAGGSYLLPVQTTGTEHTKWDTPCEVCTSTARIRSVDWARTASVWRNKETHAFVVDC